MKQITAYVFEVEGDRNALICTNNGPYYAARDLLKRGVVPGSIKAQYQIPYEYIGCRGDSGRVVLRKRPIGPRRAARNRRAR